MAKNVYTSLQGHLKAKGYAGQDAKNIARATLTRAGEMKGDTLTSKGKKRSAMGAAGRAKSRKK